MINLKDKYGQVFLKDEIIAMKICNLIPPHQNIIEIGFGDIFLTKFIIKYNEFNKLLLYEIDKFFFKKHINFLSKISNTEVFNDDFIKVLTNKKLNYKQDFIIVSNIAFNIFKKTITEIILNKYFNITRILVLIPKDIGLSLLHENCAFAKFTSFFYKSEIAINISQNIFERNIPFSTCILDMKIKYEFLNLNNIIDLYKFIKFLFKQKRKIIKWKNFMYNLRPHELSHNLIIQLYQEYNNEFNK